MGKKSVMADLVLRVVSQAPGCSLDELAWACPELTWNQVFFAVDDLSQKGLIRLKQHGVGRYTVWPGEHSCGDGDPGRHEPSS